MFGTQSLVQHLLYLLIKGGGLLLLYYIGIQGGDTSKYQILFCS